MTSPLRRASSSRQLLLIVSMNDVWQAPSYANIPKSDSSFVSILEFTSFSQLELYHAPFGSYIQLCYNDEHVQEKHQNSEAGCITMHKQFDWLIMDQMISHDHCIHIGSRTCNMARCKRTPRILETMGMTLMCHLSKLFALEPTKGR